MLLSLPTSKWRLAGFLIVVRQKRKKERVHCHATRLATKKTPLSPPLTGLGLEFCTCVNDSERRSIIVVQSLGGWGTFLLVIAHYNKAVRRGEAGGGLKAGEIL